MQLIVFLLIYPILWIISILPFRLFYFFSDFIFLLVYRVIGYRKKTVRDNLKLALPHLSDVERKKIEVKFYQHLCDMFLEMVKTMTISKSEMQKRFKITNVEVIKEYEQKGKSIALMASHYATYEWLLAMNDYATFHGVGVYKKIKNKYFDRLVRRIRSKFKAELVETKDTIPVMRKYKREGKLTIYGLASDQSPKMERAFHWNSFMGIEVPVHTGAEMLSKKLDMNVIMVRVTKVKRGFYECNFLPLAENVSDIPDFEITEKYLRELEKQILAQPEYYLWTHKRWKLAGQKPK